MTTTTTMSAGAAEVTGDGAGRGAREDAASGGALWRAVDFGAQIPSVLPQPQLWRHVETAFIDSHATPIWPNAFNWVHSTGLREGALVTVYYNLGLVRRRLQYRVVEWEAGRAFRYAATASHPFEGGARVEVVEDGEGSRLRWEGRYRFGPLAWPAAAFFKGFFERAFFAALRRGIASVEEQAGG